MERNTTVPFQLIAAWNTPEEETGHGLGALEHGWGIQKLATGAMTSPTGSPGRAKPRNRLRLRGFLFAQARPPGLEPGTLGLEGRCSIHLSYERSLVEKS